MNTFLSLSEPQNQSSVVAFDFFFSKRVNISQTIPVRIEKIDRHERN